jgi:hypothetical protein
VIGVRIRNKELSPVKSRKEIAQNGSDSEAEEVNGRFKYFEVKHIMVVVSV